MRAAPPAATAVCVWPPGRLGRVRRLQGLAATGDPRQGRTGQAGTGPPGPRPLRERPAAEGAAGPGPAPRRAAAFPVGIREHAQRRSPGSNGSCPSPVTSAGRQVVLGTGNCPPLSLAIGPSRRSDIIESTRARGPGATQHHPTRRIRTQFEPSCCAVPSPRCLPYSDGPLLASACAPLLSPRNRESAGGARKFASQKMRNVIHAGRYDGN